jgi:hypothetical protein
MSKSDHYFIKERGADRFAKFQANDPTKPFGQGTYVLSEGLTGAAVFTYIHAAAFIDGLKHQHDLQMVDAMAEISRQQQ